MSKRNSKAQAKSQLVEQVAIADGITVEQAEAIVNAAEAVTHSIENEDTNAEQLAADTAATDPALESFANEEAEAHIANKLFDKDPSMKPARKGRAKKELDANDPFMKQTIILKRLENPKRPSSKAFKRFALYRDGMSVYEFIKAGGTRGDVNWDVAHQHIELIPFKS